ncbi:hypothetical protein DNTS_030388 [Danionella cerebrum]|uniref:DH domain-containing protein n=1 Tax=Danionella cerebrum TaxID=2873325 RepID=A0A553QX24_9TELE|nr:hypothetical protein DNTS_030388 [Danionella translucida]
MSDGRILSFSLDLFLKKGFLKNGETQSSLSGRLEGEKEFKDDGLRDMDTVKASFLSKGPDFSNTLAPEESALAQRQVENGPEGDVLDGHTAVLSAGQRRAQEKNRYNTIGYQKKKQRAAVDFSTVSKGTAVKSRAALKQVLLSQGSSDRNGSVEERSGGSLGQMDALKQVLDSFSSTLPADLSWKWGVGGAERTLEKSWTDIVHSQESMSKTQRHQQEALWELLSTELTHVNKLTVAKEVSPMMLFSNLPSILEAHQLLWQEVMYPMLQEVRLTGRPFDPLKLEAGCLQFPDRFPAYFDYCLEMDRNVEFTRRQLETNPHFHTYLKWVENHPQCGRMRLGDMQAKPHQRITKYPLLLKAIQKNTEDLPTRNALDRMLNSVDHFIQSINDYLQLKEDTLALSVAAQRIEGYRIEGLSEEIAKHVRALCSFDLTSPIRGTGPNVIRKQVLEETLKVRRRKETKELVVLLFTDVLLMTKTQKKSEKLKVVRPPLPLERIHCIELKDGNSFMLLEVGDLGCPISVSFLSASSPDSCASWLSVLRETQVNAAEKLENLGGQSSSDTEPDLENSQGKLLYNQSPSESETDLAESMQSMIFHQHKSDAQLWVDVEDMEVVKEDKNSPLGDSAPPKTEEQQTRKNSAQWEEDEAIQNKHISERRVTWNRRQRSSPQIPELGETVGEQEYNGEESSSVLPSAPFITTERVDEDEKIRSSSIYSQLGEDEQFLQQSKRFSRKLKSPRLRRRRPHNMQVSESPEMEINGLEVMWQENSNREPNLAIKQQDSHRVLKLGSLKTNHGSLWNLQERKSLPEPEEMPEEKRKLKMVKLKSSSNSKNTPLCPSPPPPPLHPAPPAPDPQPLPSPLQSLLLRAKEREKERGRREVQRSYSLQNSPTISASPPLSASEAESTASSLVSAPGWREGNVDGSEDEMKDSDAVPEGISVDWPGWCFDDEEVFNFEDFDDDWFEQMLIRNELRRSEIKSSEQQDEAEWSEV